MCWCATGSRAAARELLLLWACVRGDSAADRITSAPRSSMWLVTAAHSAWRWQGRAWAAGLRVPRELHVRPWSVDCAMGGSGAMLVCWGGRGAGSSAGLVGGSIRTHASELGLHSPPFVLAAVARPGAERVSCVAVIDDT